jgi:hypothetical protein
MELTEWANEELQTGNRLKASKIFKIAEALYDRHIKSRIESICDY